MKSRRPKIKPDRLHKILDATRLPRRQQDKIVEVVSALMTQYEQSK